MWQPVDIEPSNGLRFGTDRGFRLGRNGHHLQIEMPRTWATWTPMTGQKGGHRMDGAAQASLFVELTGRRCHNRSIRTLEVASRLDPQSDPSVQDQAHPLPLRSQRKCRSSEV
jgi:hypothetical protein